MTKNDLFGKKYEWPIITPEILSATQKQLYESISIYDASGVILELEQKMASYYGKKHALLTSSGTAALQSMYFSLMLQDDDEIICCSYGFFATVSPHLHFRGKVIFVDCDEDGNIAYERVAENITKQTKAIVFTDMWGRPLTDYEKFVSLCRKHNIYLVEDASHCHGGKINNIPIGYASDVLIMSLQGNKIITGGEGGILLTDNDELYYKSIFYGHYNKRCKQQLPLEHDLRIFARTGAGLKLRIHPIAARIASTMFDHLSQIVDERRAFAEVLDRGLRNNPLIQLMEIPASILHSRYAYTFTYIGDKLTGISTSEFVSLLIQNGIADADLPGSTGLLAECPIFTEKKYVKQLNLNSNYVFASYENAEYLSKHIVKLPCWQKDWICMADYYVEVISKVTAELLRSAQKHLFYIKLDN